MKALIPLFLLLLFTTTLSAQNDTAGYWDVYRNENQQLLSPALAGEMGKHIVRTDFSFLKRVVVNTDNPMYYWQAAWQTQWNNHGFALVSKNIPSSQLLSSHTLGLQYAYGFGLGKSNFWKNSRLSLGVGMNMTKEAASNNLVYVDQFDTNGVKVNSRSGEKAVDNISYPDIEAGLAFRSKKMYLTTTFQHLTGSQNGFYATMPLQTSVQIQAGVKLAEWKRLAGWLVFDQYANYSSHIGLALSYRHLMATYKRSTLDPNNLFQLSYLSPRLRIYAEYETKTLGLTTTYNSSFIRTGIAIGITKQ